MLKSVVRRIGGAVFGKSTAPGTTIVPEFPEFESFQELHNYSIKNHEEFWARMSRSMISWQEDFSITGKRL